MDDSKSRVAIPDRFGDDAKRDEIVDLLEIDFLALELLMNAVQSLDAAVNLHDGNLCFVQLDGDRPLEILNQGPGSSDLQLDLRAKSFVHLGLQILERQLLQLVLHLAHPEAMSNGRVDIERFPGYAYTSIFRQEVKRPHVVQAIPELHEDDADVIHHGQEHLSEVFGLALLAR